jgi:hypothetical protein
MAKVWFSGWPPVGHKIGQIANIKKALGILPKGILAPSFIEIAPAVMKRALLMEDEDGRHVIAIAHQRWAKKEWNSISFSINLNFFTGDICKMWFFFGQNSLPTRPMSCIHVSIKTRNFIFEGILACHSIHTHTAHSCKRSPHNHTNYNNPWPELPFCVKSLSQIQPNSDEKRNPTLDKLWRWKTCPILFYFKSTHNKKLFATAVVLWLIPK